MKFDDRKFMDFIAQSPDKVKKYFIEDDYLGPVLQNIVTTAYQQDIILIPIFLCTYSCLEEGIGC